MDADYILRYLTEHPNYVGILKRAVEVEEAHAEDGYWLGWSWDMVRAYPATIHKLIVDGLVKVSYNSAKFTNYKLVDLEATKEALKAYEREYKEYVKLQGQQVVKREIEIPDDLFSTIVKRDDLVKLFKYSLEAEKPVNILMVSKPGVAKTVILLEISRLPNAEYILGSSTTKAGLSDQLFRRFKDGDKCFILIDEIDKMRAEDYGCLLSLQETGIVKDVKSGKTREMRLNATVYAAANSLKRIPKENLDRFEIIRVPEYTDDEFIEVVKGVLMKREGASEDIAEYIARNIPKKNVRQAIRVFRASKGDKKKVDDLIQLLKKFGE